MSEDAGGRYHNHIDAVAVPSRSLRAQGRRGDHLRRAVTVTKDGEAATVYSDDRLTTVVASPTTDEDGRYSFYVGEGTFEVTVADTDTAASPMPVEWRAAAAPPGGGAATLADLSDVDLTGAAEGDVLTIDAEGLVVPSPSGTSGTVRAAAPTGVSPTDSAAITAAIAALPAGGGVVELAPGTYVGRFYVDKANVTLRGAGKFATTLQLPSALNTQAQTLTIVADGVTIESLGVDGNRDNNTIAGVIRECDGVSIYASKTTIRDCYVTRSTGHGIIVWNEATSGHNGAPNASRAIGNRTYNKILNCYLEDIGHAADARSCIDIATSTGNTHNLIQGNVIVAGSVAGSTWSSGITMHSGSLTDIVNNFIVCPSTERATMNHTGAYGNRWIGNVVTAKSATAGAQYFCNVVNASDSLYEGNYFESGQTVTSLLNADETLTNIRVVNNTVKAPVTRTEATVIRLAGTPVISNISAQGNQGYNSTAAVTPASKIPSVRVVDHFIDNVIVERTRSLRVGEAPSATVRSGLWYSSPFVGPTPTAGTYADGSLYLLPLDLPSCTLDRIGIEITIVGGASGVWRLGLYADDGNGYPGALALDAGTVDATILSSTTERSITISYAHAGGRLWAAIVQQGGAAASTVRQQIGAVFPMGANGPDVAAQGALAGYRGATGVTGALPSSISSGSVTPTTRMPRIAVRIV